MTEILGLVGILRNSSLFDDEDLFISPSSLIFVRSCTPVVLLIDSELICFSNLVAPLLLIVIMPFDPVREWWVWYSLAPGSSPIEIEEWLYFLYLIF